MEEFIKKSDILIEALPYIQAFQGRVIVAKYGGSAVDNPAAMKGILQDLVFLSAVGIRAVLVHGGGPAITQKLAALGQKSAFLDGMRVTDKAAMRVVNEALAEVNHHLVRQIKDVGGAATSITPPKTVIDAAPHARAAELGFVGTVKAVHTAPLTRIFARRAIPVVSPVGVGADGQLYNINADDVASEVAAALHAEKLVLLTNVRGILRQAGDVSSLISTLSTKEAKMLMDRHVIQEGMIPKVGACIDALRGGVKKTHVIDATLPHAMLLEIFTKKGIGTEILR